MNGKGNRVDPDVNAHIHEEIKKYINEQIKEILDITNKKNGEVELKEVVIENIIVPEKKLRE